VSNDSSLPLTTADERARMKRQLGDHAVRLAVGGRWDEAVNVNREYVRLFPEDPEGLNRLGKALSELGRIDEALQAYQQSLDLDPTNTIARRNLDRLSTLPRDAIAAAAPSQVDTRLFVEEAGKAAVANLQAVDNAVTAQVKAGDRVELQVKGKAVNVHARNGEYMGMVEPRIGLRLAKLIDGGNQYAAALITASGEQPRVIIRETFQHPSQIDRVSFPQSLAADIRPYIRRSVLRHQLAESLEFSDDEEVEEEDEERGWTETGEDVDVAAEVGIDTSDDEDEYE
jgi:hypothetical protein